MSNGAHVLIIDDEAQMRKLFRITLQSNGYDVMGASTAKEWVINAANHPPDMLLPNLGLPDEDAHFVLKQLSEWYANPVIILSVQSDEHNNIRALDSGWQSPAMFHSMRSRYFFSGDNVFLNDQNQPTNKSGLMIGGLTAKF